jgi:hypothetical protein
MSDQVLAITNEGCLHRAASLESFLFIGYFAGITDGISSGFRCGFLSKYLSRK